MKTILVPIDFSPATRAVVTEATALARICHGRIVLMSVIQSPTPVAAHDGFVQDLMPILVSQEKAAAMLLARWVRDLKSRRIAVRAIHIDGYPAVEIAKQAKRLRASYIVIGSHGHSAFYDLVVGSTTTGVLRKASCPVIVVPGRPTRTRKA